MVCDACLSKYSSSMAQVALATYVVSFTHPNTVKMDISSFFCMKNASRTSLRLPPQSIQLNCAAGGAWEDTLVGLRSLRRLLQLVYTTIHTAYAVVLLQNVRITTVPRIAKQNGTDRRLLYCNTDPLEGLAGFELGLPALSAGLLIG